MKDEDLSDAIIQIQCIWAFLLLALYTAGFIDARLFSESGAPFPEREEILLKAQRVLFFGVMIVGFLIDIVRMRLNRNYAYQYLLLSLVMGSFSEMISGWHWKFWSSIF
jgi:hypothetical protein